MTEEMKENLVLKQFKRLNFSVFLTTPSLRWYCYQCVVDVAELLLPSPPPLPSFASLTFQHFFNTHVLLCFQSRAWKLIGYLRLQSWTPAWTKKRALEFRNFAGRLELCTKKYDCCPKIGFSKLARSLPFTSTPTPLAYERVMLA